MFDREEKERKEREQYNKFLAEAMVTEEADAIPVPDMHDSLARKVRDWGGTGPLPHTAQDDMIDDVVDKILKKEPKEDGTSDELREGEEAEDSDSDAEECKNCDETIKEIFEELGISPMDLLEGDDEEEKEEEEKEEEGEKSESDSDAEVSESVDPNERSILEQLINEMTLFEEEDADEMSDEVEETEDEDEELED